MPQQGVRGQRGKARTGVLAVESERLKTVQHPPVVIDGNVCPRGHERVTDLTELGGQPSRENAMGT